MKIKITPTEILKAARKKQRENTIGVNIYAKKIHQTNKKKYNRKKWK